MARVQKPTLSGVSGEVPGSQGLLVVGSEFVQLAIPV